MDLTTAVVGVFFCLGAVVAERPSKLTEACRRYAESVPDNNSCLKASGSDEASGNSVGLGQYAHMAVIAYGNETSIVRLCAGSLISDKFVLGAAHCASGSKRGPAKYVVLGEFVSQDGKGKGKSNVYEITSIIIHPDYKASSFHNDISLFKLNTSVQFTDYIRPVCLSTDKQIPEGKITATSWSYDLGDPDHKAPNEVESFVKTEEDCRNFYNSSGDPKLTEAINYETTLCATNVYSGKDVCLGDIGGPLQTRHPQLPCMYLQVGIASFGPICGGQFMTYTRVSHYVPWIESVVWP